MVASARVIWLCACDRGLVFECHLLLFSLSHSPFPIPHFTIPCSSISPFFLPLPLPLFPYYYYSPISPLFQQESEIRPFPSCLMPLIQNESKCENEFDLHENEPNLSG